MIQEQDTQQIGKSKYEILIETLYTTLTDFCRGSPKTFVYDLDENSHHYATGVSFVLNSEERGERALHPQTLWRLKSADMRRVKRTVMEHKAIFLQSSYEPKTHEKLKRLYDAVKKEAGHVPGILYICDLDSPRPEVYEFSNGVPENSGKPAD